MDIGLPDRPLRFYIINSRDRYRLGTCPLIFPNAAQNGLDCFRQGLRGGVLKALKALLRASPTLNRRYYGRLHSLDVFYLCGRKAGRRSNLLVRKFQGLKVAGGLPQLF